MRLFLASYKYGGHEKELINFYKSCKKIGLILNSQDTPIQKELRSQKVNDDLNDWRSFGFETEEIDLRNFFGKEKELVKVLKNFDGLWVRGGNCFSLRMAMKKSAFDEILKNRLKENSLVYGGYSAGICILGKTLHGLELCDDIESVFSMYGNLEWGGLNILDYTIVPHYKSDHPESLDMENVIEYLSKEVIDYKPLRDNEVIVIDGDREELLA